MARSGSSELIATAILMSRAFEMALSFSELSSVRERLIALRIAGVILATFPNLLGNSAFRALVWNVGISCLRTAATLSDSCRSVPSLGTFQKKTHVLQLPPGRPFFK